MRPHTLLLVLPLALSACSEDEKKEKKAITGTYESTDPVCANTKTAPEFTSEVLAVRFGSFTGLVERTVEISSKSVSLTFRDEDCELKMTQGLISNDGSNLIMNQNLTHTWTPDGCALAVQFNGTTTAVTKDYGSGAIFKDTSGDGAGNQLSTKKSGGKVIVSTQELSNLGCGDVVSFQWTWTKK